jgi:hypothetical protein
MDLLSRIAGWLGENEATISAVVGITVLAGLLFAGPRSLLRRRAGAGPIAGVPRVAGSLPMPFGPLVTGVVTP